MRKLILMLVAVFFSVYLPAQTIVAFHENFEAPSFVDSVTSSTDPVGGIQWALTSTLKNSGSYADSNKIQTGTTVYLTTNSFSTSGKSKVMLKFAQICKLLFNDGGSLDVSIDGGTTWVGLTQNEYRGTGTLIQSGGFYKFSESAYTDWLAGDTATKPTNLWWKNELFDISAIAGNQANVKIRFKYYGSGAPGSTGRYGWLLDDINVIASNNELYPPTLSFKNPILTDSLYYTGPFTVQVYTRDSSGIGNVQLIYNINGGADNSITMTNISDSTYSADIPSVAYNNTVNYRIVSNDIYNNSTNLPTTGYKTFYVRKGASTITVGTGTTTGSTTPVYIASSTDANLYSYYVCEIDKSELNTGGTIASLAFNKADVQGYNLNNATLRIYVKGVGTTTSVPTTYAGYVTAFNGATKVYENLAQNLNTAAGWQTFNCNAGSYNITGAENIMVFVEWYRPGNATGAVPFYYTTVAGKASTFYGTGSIPTTANTSGYRANVKINFQTSSAALDATVFNFASPTSPMTANVNVPVSVRVKNLGSTPLTQVKVNWMVDGLYQGWSTWSSTISLQQDFVGTPVNLGNVNLSIGPHILKAWTELPNGVADQVPTNDTMTYNVFACANMSGTFTVGTTSSNFPTLNDVYTALNNCGISGPVVFKLASGTYNQQLIIPLFNNVSATNTISFESATGNPNDVIFQYSSTSATDNFTIRFDGAQYIKVRNITIKNTGATYATGVEYINGASYNLVEGCKIQVQAGATSSTIKGVVNATTTLENYNTIRNNEISGGYYGVYFYGISTASKEKGNIFDGNIVKDFYYYGMYLYYQDTISALKNTVTNHASSGVVYGFYSYYSDNANYSKNKIIVNGSSTAYCMYLYYNNTGGTGTSLVANNWVSQSVGTAVYCVYNYYSKNISYNFNSFNVLGGTSTYYTFYSTGATGIKLKNNIFVNKGLGYALYAATGQIDSSNYNNFYSNGTNLAYWGVACTSLAALQTASGKDQNSMNVDPQFTSFSNLHINNYSLVGMGYPVPGVTDDIDGEIRSNTPTIGSDEIIIPTNDAGLFKINNPFVSISTLNQNIKVTVKHIGSTPLTSATIRYSVNGVLQPAYTYGGNLAQFAQDSVVIGNFTFSLGINTLKVWTEMPNNVPDVFNSNDTLTMTVVACSGPMSGNYTLGGTGANFATFNEAVLMLKNCGVSGPTVINVSPGTYTEQFIVTNIPGTTASNTVTFKAANNDSSSVILDAGAGSLGNFVAKFDGSQYITFSKMTLKNEIASGRVIEFINGAQYITITNCVLKSMVGATSSSAAVIYSYNTLENYLTIRNNLIIGGYYSIYLYGVSTASKENGHIIENNVIKDFYYYGLYLYYMNSITVKGNIVQNATTSGVVYGMYAYYNDNGIYLKNDFRINSTSTNYIMYFYYNNSTAGTSLVANNFVSQAGSVGTVYAMYCYYSNNMNYYYNSINVKAGTTSSYACYNYYGTGNNYVNNNFINTGGGYAFYVSVATSINTSDYNNIYTNSPTVYAYWGAAYTTLAALKIASGKDQHSIATDPLFYSTTDLHTDNVNLYQKGSTVAGVTDDIDGQLRPATPCIGADEFIVLPYDLKLKGLYTFGKLPKVSGAPHQVKSLIKNVGANTLTNINVTLNITGANTFTNVKTLATLAPGVEDSVIFDNFTPTSLGINNVKVTLPLDSNITDNVLNYRQEVTDSLYAYADTSKASTYLGFNTGSGLFLAKYFVNGSRLISGVSAYITNSNTIGQTLRAVVLNQYGAIVDSSANKIITASDTNTWVTFNMLNPSSSLTVNSNVYVGFAQTVGSSGYYPLGCQAEQYTRRAVFYYTTNLNGGSLTETNQFGRFMIMANLRLPAAKDATVQQIVAPSSSCGLSNETVKINILNAGMDTIFGPLNTLTASYALKSSTNTLYNIVTQQVTDTILPTLTKLFSFSTPISIPPTATNDSSYTLVSWVKLTNDAYPQNDTTSKIVVSRFTPTSPVVNSPITIGYGSNVVLNAIATDTVNWYSKVTDTVPVATGPSYTTPIYPGDTTIYAATGHPSLVTYYVGEIAPLSTAGTGGGIGTYLNFTALTNCTLKSVDMFPYGTGAGTVTIQLQTSAGVAITSATINCTGTTSPLSPAQTALLNFPLTAGTSYRLSATAWTGGVTNLYRDLTGNYPYTIPGVLSITSPSLTPYYYFWYHWAVVTGSGSGGCYSPKVPVVIHIVNGSDPAVSDIITPNSGCNLTNQTVKLKIKNKGNIAVIGSQNLLSATYGLKVGNTIINTVTQLVTDTIKAFDSVYFTFTTPINLPANNLVDSSYKLVAWTNFAADINHLNDTLSKTVISRHIPQPPFVTTPVNINFGTSTSLTAVSTDSVRWYANLADTVAFYTGATYTTPVLTDTTTYWVSAVNPATLSSGSSGNVGLLAVSSHSGGGTTTYGPQLYNDGYIPAYPATGGGTWGWTTSGGWIEYTWTTAQTFNKVVFYKDNRPMYTCTFQYWNGSAYVDFYTYNNTAIQDSVTFPAVTATKLRFYNIGGSSNPNFNEIQVFAPSVSGSNSSCASAKIPVKVNVAPGSDATVKSIINPSSGCGLSNQIVQIKIKNNGNLTILGSSNLLTAYYGLKLNNNLINVVNQTVPNTINAGDSILFSFTTPLTLATTLIDSNYTLVSWVNLWNDLNIHNDTCIKAVTSKYTPPAPTATNVSINFANTASLTATSPSPLKWYKTIASDSVIGQGSPFITPILYTTDTFYVAANTSFQNTGIIGTGNVVNTTTGYPTPYGQYYNGSKEQYLITKAELNAVGIQAGPINSIAFDVVSPPGTSLINYTVSIGHTSLTAMSTSFVTGLTQVYSNSSLMPTGGSWNTYNFTTPFQWNGVDNIVIENCFDNYPNGYTTCGVVNQTATSFVSCINYHSDGGGVCAYGTGTTYSQRPNIKIQGNTPGCGSPKTPVIVTVGNLPALDIAISNITQPLGTIATGTPLPVKAKLYNYGTTTVTSATVKWSVNGVSQPNVPLTGLNLTTGQSMIVSLGNYSFAGGPSTIKAWSSAPNAQTDMYPANDTASAVVLGCMAGTFTIGTSGTFPTFTSALNTINAVGLCGNVIFDVLPGTYNEALTINNIPTAGPNATVTFRSQNGINTSVILTTNASAAAIVKLNGASYIRFEKMTLLATANVVAAVEVSGGSTYNIFNGNIISQPNNTSSTNRAINSTSSASDNYNQFLNNTISGGYYGIYWYGASTAKKIGNIFSNNTINNFYYYGFYMYYNDSITVTKNYMTNSPSSGVVYCLYSNYVDKSIFTKNKLNVTGSSTAYCMYMYYNNSASGSSLVANNFVSQSNGTAVYGLYSYYSNNMNYYNNSINITAGSSTYYACYMYYGTGNNVVNNIFSNTGTGYAYYVSVATSINRSNYNNFYTNGGSLAYWGGTTCPNLATLKTASAKDTNSLSVLPPFFSVSDLHLVSFDLDGKGTPLALVPDDIDDSIRNATTPDIGADEFVLPNNDAGAVALILPTNPTTTGIQPVKVSIKDFGVLNLTSVSIQWSVNGVAQPSYGWSNNITSGSLDSVVIGNYNFAAGASNFKVWTSLPNGVADQLNINDTLYATIVACSGPLSGTYTIGSGTGTNFQTISNAVQSLSYCGISAPVTFNIQPGTYNEQLLIPVIPGASAINTVTFKSQNNDSSTVIINFGPTSATANYVVKLSGANYVKFKYLTLNNNQTGLGRVVEFANGASNNEFSNNVIQTPFSTTSTSSTIYSYNTIDERNIIANNVISGGYYGIYLYGVSTASKERSNIIKNNLIKDFYYYGLYLYYQDSISVIGNTVRNSAASGVVYGMYSYYSDNFNYVKNKLLFDNSSTTYAMYLYYNNSSGGNGLVANNFITQTASATVYGVYHYYTNNDKFYNNSINTLGGSTYYSIYMYYGTSNVLRNNTIVNYGGGYAIYSSVSTSISSSNYNNLYTTGGTLGYWGAACANLAAWKTTSGMDANSISLDPVYTSPTDLHLYLPMLNNIGTPVAEVTDDIDGQTRNATTPDIGADEYSPLQFDLTTKAIISPSIPYSQTGSNIQIKCLIKNYGADSVANFNVAYKAGNAAAVVQNHPAFLLSNAADTITFTTQMPVTAGPIEIKVYTDLANDGNHSNDTLKMNYFGEYLKSVPYSENFDNTNNEWFSVEANTLWEKGIPTSSVINTAHSAPNVWKTKLNANYTNNNTSVLYTPIFDNTVFRADTLKFWHWVDAELNKDGGHIEYSDDGGATWTVLGHTTPADTNATNWYNSTTANMWTGNGTGWQLSKYRVYNLPTIGNTIQFKFVFTSDATNTNNGWAIDDFELTLVPIAKDGGVTSIISPTSTSLVGDLVPVTVIIKNFGTDTLTNIPVRYQVGTGAIVTGTYPGPLVPGASANYTFTQSYQVANVNYTLCAYTEIFGDIYTQNDKTCKNVTVNPAQKDVGVTQLVQPSGYVSQNSNVTVKVQIKNYGTLTQTSIPVYYQRGNQTPVGETWTGNLVAGDTAYYTFTQQMSIPIGTSVSFMSWTKLPNDAYPFNDTISKSIPICNVALAGTITGPISVVPGSTQTYSVPVISNATSYNWVLTPSSAGTITGTGTTISILFSSTPGTASLSVNGVSAACSGSASTLNNIAIGVGVEEYDANSLWMGQNMPNPTYGITKIEYNLPTAGDIRFVVMNLFGQKVYETENYASAGKHLINMNVKDLAAGVYYYSIEFKDKRLVKKMVVNK